MCDTDRCRVNDCILIPEAVEYGGSLFYGQSPISRQWLLARFTFLAISLCTLCWSISYHILNHKWLEWLYWLNNWCLLLSAIYFSLSCLCTYKIYRFVNQQQSKLLTSSCSNSQHKHSAMMSNRETTSFALKNPATKKYKSLPQNDNEESSVLHDIPHPHDEANHPPQHVRQHQDDQDEDENHDRLQNMEPSPSKSDDDGGDKQPDEQQPECSQTPKQEQTNMVDEAVIDDIMNVDEHRHAGVQQQGDDNISVHSADSENSSYSSATIHLVKLHNDSDETYNSFRVDSKRNMLDLHHEHHDHDDMFLRKASSSNYRINNEIIFWLFTMKRMRMTGMASMYKKFQQTVVSLNMVTVIIYITFLYEYNVDFMNAIRTADTYELVFSVLINSNLMQCVLFLIEYYSSALRMSYTGFIYPLFIGICYCIMSVIFSVSQLQLQQPTNEKLDDTNDDEHALRISHMTDDMQIDNLLNASIGKMYLTLCCDWMRHPIHALLHMLSISLILLIFHVLFTCTKNVILCNIWSYHDRHHHNETDEEDKQIAMKVVSVESNLDHKCRDIEAAHANGSDHYWQRENDEAQNRIGDSDNVANYNIISDGHNLKIIQKQQVCDVNMESVEESSIILDASVSHISTSIVEVQYENAKQAQKGRKQEWMRSRLLSSSDLERRAHLAVLDADIDDQSMYEENINIDDEDDLPSSFLYPEKEGDLEL